MKQVTLLFLRREGEILLAMKKQRFGAGKWNGAGGKVEPGETPLQAAIRETEEEIGVTPLNPRLVGRMYFTLDDNPAFEHDCYIYVATEWRGQPSESEEMRPQWFKEGAIPYPDMWPDDQYWMPMLLAGQGFEGEVAVHGDRLTHHAFRKIDAISEAPRG